MLKLCKPALSYLCPFAVSKKWKLTKDVIMRIKVSVLLAAFAVASLFLIGVGEEIEFPSISIKASKESNEGEGKRLEGREVDDRYFVQESKLSSDRPKDKSASALKDVEIITGRIGSRDNTFGLGLGHNISSKIKGGGVISIVDAI